MIETISVDHVKIGMRIIGTDEHDFLGELLVYELRREAAPPA